VSHIAKYFVAKYGSMPMEALTADTTRTHETFALKFGESRDSLKAPAAQSWSV
jgi:hypothetical protein